MSDQRSRFDLPAGIYLLSHSVGCRPAALAHEFEERFMAPWRYTGGDAWPAWLGEVDRFREALARLLNADVHAFCPQANLSSALTKIIHALPFDARRPYIVLSELDFPSIGFVISQAERAGYRLRFIKRDADVADPAAWSAALRDDVRMVCATHVLSNTGQRLPVAEIAASARAQGIYSIIDIAQSAGVVPIDLTAWDADFAIGSCVKWLCGGPGAGFLWVSARALPDCAPLDVGWFSHESPFEFDIRDFRYAPDARRFWGGTPSIAPFITATVGIETLLAIDVDTIAQHNAALIDLVTEAVPAAVIRSPGPRAARGGTMVVATPEMDRLTRALDSARIRCDRRVDGVRLSPHIYNTAEEMQVLTSCINDSL